MASVQAIVFISLVLDLFAFTIPLPLFPRLIQWYTLRENSIPNGLLARTLQFVTSFRSIFYKSGEHSQRWDVVLLGGLMGSVFSTLQFIVSPRIGALSDKYGRKPILLLSMIGNLLSALIWIQSTTFASYMLSRVVGGLSEGNVQLAIAILSDVTPPETRSKALAQVGIAFAICFCIGPPVGAYFASRPLPKAWSDLGIDLNIYAAPALLTFVLLSAETAFLFFALPETRSTIKNAHLLAKKTDKAPTSGDKRSTAKRTVQTRLNILKSLGRFHFFYLAIFSGVEFTLTFLTFDLLDWSNTQNGMLIGSIGIISALLQGGYVRRSMSKVGEGRMAIRGVGSCALALVFLSVLPKYVESQPGMAIKLLQLSAVFMAFTSATVVNALTSFASLQCDQETVDEVTGKRVEEHPQLAKGKVLGKFRSSGQLGRALGPLLACASYWTFGPSVTYAVSAVAMLCLYRFMRPMAKTNASWH